MFKVCIYIMRKISELQKFKDSGTPNWGCSDCRETGDSTKSRKPLRGRVIRVARVPMLPVHPQPWTPSSPRGNVAAASPLTQALIYPSGRVNNPFSLSVPGKYSKTGLAQRGRDGDPVCEGEEKWPDKGLRDKLSELPPRGRMPSGTHEVQKKWPEQYLSC